MKKQQPKRASYEQAIEILTLRSQCIRPAKIAEQVDLPLSTINRVLRKGEGWIVPRRGVVGS